ncbi:HPP family protein [Candidatus Magnetobacterium casense]|uniref:HPP family protein n=1 Tax=Candidatus Magnetobacterium casense TaxID=1455061 RepID=A0ABS6S3U7_9BACT|nr:HPP family protein [Candidatus Magnetobacterium casensis]MBV6343043.1 HPP family protein [Candidatus Magnetobacterium casensis]
MSKSVLNSYIDKMTGHTKNPQVVDVSEIFWSWVGAFWGISAVALLHYKVFKGMDMMMLIGSFGASAVLIYAAIKSPLAQPRNLLGGHILSGLVGVAAYNIFGGHLWLAAPMAVATAIAVMLATKTLHPPGGATALIAVIGGADVHAQGFLYALIPAGSGAIIMLLVALIVNNIPKTRRYPEFWF